MGSSNTAYFFRRAKQDQLARQASKGQTFLGSSSGTPTRQIVNVQNNQPVYHHQPIKATPHALVIGTSPHLNPSPITLIPSKKGA